MSVCTHICVFSNGACVIYVHVPCKVLVPEHKWRKKNKITIPNNSTGTIFQMHKIIHINLW